MSTHSVSAISFLVFMYITEQMITFFCSVVKARLSQFARRAIL